MKTSSVKARLFASGLISLCLTACGVSQPQPVKTTTVRFEPPELVPCERISDNDEDVTLNGDLWALKDRAVNLLDTCADQVDAQILRSKSK